MRIGSTQDRHLDDAERVQYIDQEGSPPQRLRWEDHIRSCPLCRTEVADLRDRSKAVTAWLRLADVQQPIARPTAARPHASAGRAQIAGGVGTWLKAAVIVLLVAAPVLAITPAGDWLADRLGLVDLESVATLNSAPQGETGLTGTLVRFGPTPGPFSVELQAGQARGAMTLGRVPAGAEAVFEVTSGAPAPDAMVAAGGIRIENQAASNTSYRLLLPPEVTAVRLSVGGHHTDISGRDLDRGTVLSLDRAGRQP
jgi:hypothetical protein